MQINVVGLDIAKDQTGQRQELEKFGGVARRRTPASAGGFMRRQRDPSAVELHSIAADRDTEPHRAARAVNLDNELRFGRTEMRHDLAECFPIGDQVYTCNPVPLMRANASEFERKWILVYRAEIPELVFASMHNMADSLYNERVLSFYSPQGPSAALTDLILRI